MKTKQNKKNEEENGRISVWLVPFYEGEQNKGPYNKDRLCICLIRGAFTTFTFAEEIRTIDTPRALPDFPDIVREN